MFCKILSLFSKKSCCCTLSKGQEKIILIVEDEPGQRLAIQKIIEKAGYKTLLAENGAQGLAEARAHKPDLIVLDVVMPHIDGIEVCRQLKDEASTMAIPIIFLTSQDSPDDVVRHFDLGADMHLAKPVDAKELLSQIQTSFENPRV
ncbi:MAG: response regulator [Candidatus Aceula meridiana]|nr:response regulator [Candidatus Aceula meridiana]